MSSKNIHVQLAHCDHIELQILASGAVSIQVQGCSQMMSLTQHLQQTYGADFRVWPYPSGVSHAELLWKEFLQKLHQKWTPPYTDEEVCHCRKVSLKRVEEAILRGALTTEMITEKTQASSACGTCRPDVDKILAWRKS